MLKAGYIRLAIGLRSTTNGGKGHQFSRSSFHSLSQGTSVRRTLDKKAKISFFLNERHLLWVGDLDFECL